MSLQSAESFVKRAYEDDEFLKQLFRDGVFIGTGSKSKEEEEAQKQKFAEVAQDYGYDFNRDEYDQANNTYMQSVGAWKGIKLIFHIMKIGKAVEKEKK